MGNRLSSGDIERLHECIMPLLMLNTGYLSPGHGYTIRLGKTDSIRWSNDFDSGCMRDELPRMRDLHALFYYYPLRPTHELTIPLIEDRATCKYISEIKTLIKKWIHSHDSRFVLCGRPVIKQASCYRNRMIVFPLNIRN